MNDLTNIVVIKKGGGREKWSRKKLLNAINNAAIRTRSYIYSDEIVITRQERSILYNLIEDKVLAVVAGKENKEITTEVLHSFIIDALEAVAPDIAKVYRDYHNYRITEAREYENVMNSIENLVTNGNLDNANSDSMLVATQNNLAACFIEQSRLENYFLTVEEKNALNAGFIYLHDKDHRMLYPYNCCLFLMENLINNGYEINGVKYTKPKKVRTMLAELKDTILSCTASQYGGFTISRIESLIAKYAKYSYDYEYEKELNDQIENYKNDNGVDEVSEDVLERIKDRTDKKVKNIVLDDIKQGYQGLEYGLNTVASSRGDFPFTTISFGNSLYGDYWAEKTCEIILKVRQSGQGDPGKKKPVIFPKLCFLYDETLHGKGMPYEDLYLKAVDCSGITMYPDYISLTGYGHVSDIYTRYNGIKRIFNKKDPREVVKCEIEEGYLDGRLVPLDDPRRKEGKYSHGHPEVAISSMGCRSFLSPYYSHTDIKNIKNLIPDIEALKEDPNYEVYAPTKLGFVRYKNLKNGYTYTTNIKDHFYPIVEEEVPIYEGRQNNGVITLNLPLIYEYCKQNEIDFFNKLDYYMQMIRKLHIRSIEFNSKKKASINPYAFMYGGLIDTNGKPTKKRPSDDIKSILACGTSSFGVTALNELQLLYNKKSIRQVMEDKFNGVTDEIPFCEKVVDFINAKIDEYKNEDNIMYSIYGTPAEKLSGTQMKQFKKMYPRIRVAGFTNNTWVSNSFHIHVSEDIKPSQKQDFEFDLFHKFNGGHIQYVRINSNFNKLGMASIIRRGMSLGFYQGVNLDLNYCDDCGWKFDSNNMEICECPKCKSKRITSIARICGYLGYTRRGSFIEENENGEVVSSGNRINECMVDNIKARKCM